MCKRIFASQTSETGEVPFYKIGTLGGMPDAYISKKLFNEYKQNYRFPKAGEILISCSGTIGRCIQYDGKDAYFQDSNIVWLVNDQTKITNEFLFYLISRYDWSFLNASTIKRLFTKDLNNLKIYYPKNQHEQILISNFISILASKIKNIESKINILKKYKKGLCNFLFINDKNSDIHLYDLVENKSSQMLTKDIEKNVGFYPVYDATGKVYKNIDFYQQTNDSISIIKYGSGCGRTFISKGYHSILGTMTDLIPLNKNDVQFLYAYTISNTFRKIVKKYTEIGTTPNLYFSDYSKATIPLKAIANKGKVSKLIINIEEHENTLESQLNQLKLMKKNLLNLLFI